MNKLKLAVAIDDISDMSASNFGSSRGEDNGHSKLREEQVLAMRQLRAEGQTYREIAEQFGVLHTTAWMAITGAAWSHLPGAQPARKYRRTSEADRAEQ